MSKIGFISQYTFLLALYNESNDLLTFLCLPNNTICQTLKNTLLFPIKFLRSTQNAYHTPISWGLGTDNSRWRPGLKNTVDAEAIRNPIHAFFLPKQKLCQLWRSHKCWTNVGDRLLIFFFFFGEEEKWQNLL